MLQIQGDGVGFAVVGQGDGVGHVPARMRGPGAEEEGGGAQIQGAQAPGERVVAERTQVEIRTVEEKAGPVWGLGQCGHGIVPAAIQTVASAEGTPRSSTRADTSAHCRSAQSRTPPPAQQQEEKVHKDIDAQQTQERRRFSRRTMEDFTRPRGFWLCFDGMADASLAERGGVCYSVSASSTGESCSALTQSPPLAKASCMARAPSSSADALRPFWSSETSWVDRAP